MQRGVLAYNPVAGRYPSRLLSERAANVFRDHGWQINIKQTKGSDHITQMALQAAADEMDAFFIAGGDGSLNRAVAGLVGTETALGVLPAGTANVWAQELGLPGLTWTRWMALEESAYRLAQGQVREIDIGVCNGSPFLLWAGLGLDAFIVHRIEPRSRWVKHIAGFHYVASAVWHASFWRGMNLRVEVDGERIDGHYLLALVSNIHLYAGGLAILTSNGLLNDGEMDLWLFEGETLGDVVQLAYALWAGSHNHSQVTNPIPCRHLFMESDSPLYVQIDAEPLEVIGGVTIEVRSRSLRVLVPEVTPQKLFGGDQ